MASSGREMTLRGARIVLVSAIALVAWVGNGPAAKQVGNGQYLALGDSVAFGYIRDAGFAYVNADNFVGYPDYVATALSFTEASAACPGEATTGFISATGADNGCRTFRASSPLHVAYASTQLAFATAFLTANPTTQLVTIGIGANDVDLLNTSCATNSDPPACVRDGLPALLATIEDNVATILSALRATGFQRVLMLVTYYSVDYTDPNGTGVIEQLNQALTAHAQANGAVVADVFTAFKTAATTSAGGKTCNAGLLNVDPKNQSACDAHPSQSGQKLIAQTVQNAYAAATASPTRALERRFVGLVIQGSSPDADVP